MFGKSYKYLKNANIPIYINKRINNSLIRLNSITDQLLYPIYKRTVSNLDNSVIFISPNRKALKKNESYKINNKLNIKSFSKRLLRPNLSDYSEKCKEIENRNKIIFRKNDEKLLKIENNLKKDDEKPYTLNKTNSSNNIIEKTSDILTKSNDLSKSLLRSNNQNKNSKIFFTSIRNEKSDIQKLLDFEFKKAKYFNFQSRKYKSSHKTSKIMNSLPADKAKEIFFYDNISHMNDEDVIARKKNIIKKRKEMIYSKSQEQIDKIKDYQHFQYIKKRIDNKSQNMRNLYSIFFSKESKAQFYEDYFYPC